MAIDIDQIASELLVAEDQRTPIDPVSQRYRDLSVSDAYRVQAHIVKQKIARGQQPAGWKIGATNAAAQAKLGVDGPVYGRLFTAGRILDKGTIATHQLIHPRIECEITFVLGSDLAGPDIDQHMVLDASEAVMGSFEIVDPRTKDWALGECELVADNGVTARYVLGKAHPTGNDLDLAAVGVSLFCNGEKIAAGEGASVLGHPARAVAWLANQLGRQGTVLGAGDIIMSGTLTPIYPAAPGDRFEARFDALGTVAVTFE